MQYIKGVIERNKTVVSNFSYLSLLQVFNMVLPLISYPYLIRVLGPDVYGKVIFAQAIIMYFALLVNFGFNISATKDVAKSISDKAKLNEIVSSVFILKLGLWILSFLILVTLIFCISGLKENSLLFVLTFGITFNELLFPQWYFQGIEKMRYITFINIFSKSLFTILIFLFVKEQGDFLLVPVFNGIGAFLGGAIALYVILSKEKLLFRWQKKTTLIYYFKESLPLFLSTASIQVYVNANRVLIGAFLGMQEVAYYDLGEKVLRLLKIPVGMLGQAAFPLLAREQKVSLINKFLLISTLATSFLVIAVFVLSDFIVNALGGSDMVQSISVLRILSLSAIMVAMSQFLGTSRLIVFGYKKLFIQIIASGGIFFGVVWSILYVLGHLNLYAFAWLATGVEVWVTGLMLVFCIKMNILWNDMTT